MRRVTWLPAKRTWSRVLALTTRCVCQELSLRQFSSFYWRIPPQNASIARCLVAFARKSTYLDNARKPRPQLLRLNEVFSLVKFEIPSAWLSAYMTTGPYNSSTLSSFYYMWPAMEKPTTRRTIWFELQGSILDSSCFFFRIFFSFNILRVWPFVYPPIKSHHDTTLFSARTAWEKEWCSIFS